MVREPLEDIRVFLKNVPASEVARTILRGDPCGAEVLADPDSVEGWVRLRIWLIDYSNQRTLDLDPSIVRSGIGADFH